MLSCLVYCYAIHMYMSLFMYMSVNIDRCCVFAVLGLCFCLIILSIWTDTSVTGRLGQTDVNIIKQLALSSHMQLAAARHRYCFLDGIRVMSISNINFFRVFWLSSINGIGTCLDSAFTGQMQLLGKIPYQLMIPW